MTMNKPRWQRARYSALSDEGLADCTMWVTERPPAGFRPLCATIEGTGGRKVPARRVLITNVYFFEDELLPVERDSIQLLDEFADNVLFLGLENWLRQNKREL